MTLPFKISTLWNSPRRVFVQALPTRAFRNGQVKCQRISLSAITLTTLRVQSVQFTPSFEPSRIELRIILISSHVHVQYILKQSSHQSLVYALINKCTHSPLQIDRKDTVNDIVHICKWLEEYLRDQTGFYSSWKGYQWLRKENCEVCTSNLIFQMVRESRWLPFTLPFYFDSFPVCTQTSHIQLNTTESSMDRHVQTKRYDSSWWYLFQNQALAQRTIW